MSSRRPESPADRPSLWEFDWKWLPSADAVRDEELLKNCAALFSREYGFWGSGGLNPGGRIRMSVAAITDHLKHSDSWLACAFHGPRLVGYCTALRFQLSDRGAVAWVTQLVVASAYRRHRVGTTLLYGIWQFSDCYAWGLITANPFAVRALETATRRPCRRALILDQGERILRELSEKVQYAPSTFVHSDDRATPRVDTGFFIDHGDIPTMRKMAARRDRPWSLGYIDEGEEWFACTFRSQAPDAIDHARLEQLLTGADEIWIQAYEGMTLDEGHRWHASTDHEVQNLLKLTALPDASRVLDVGCGDGRHSLALARKGHKVVGVDISARLIGEARRRAGGLDVTFQIADARDPIPGSGFDLAVCLYDVLGSSADINDDRAMLRNIRQALRPGGLAVLSVMNTFPALSRLKPDRQPNSLPQFVSALEALPPSATMETTGAVFDPSYLLYFDGVYFRKEQFEAADWRLPSELVVRDKRYTVEELSALLNHSGLEVVSIFGVQAGAWDRDPPLDQRDHRAKELLAVVRNPGA